MSWWQNPSPRLARVFFISGFTIRYSIYASWKLKVKEDKVSEYLEIADKADIAVEADETGMLHHTFDQGPDNPLPFVWSEFYKNDDALLAHLADPA